MILHSPPYFFFFFFNDPAPPEIYPLPLHDALPISLLATARTPRARRDRRIGHRLCPWRKTACPSQRPRLFPGAVVANRLDRPARQRSEEHTSELQSPCNLVCRLLLEKKKNDTMITLCTSPIHALTRSSLHARTTLTRISALHPSSPPTAPMPRSRSNTQYRPHVI